MSNFEEFVTRGKRSVEDFIRTPNKETLRIAEEELEKCDSIQLQLFQSRLLTPLMLKLDKLNGENIELQTGIMRQMKVIISRSYLKNVNAVKTMLMVLLKQIRDFASAKTKPNLSEEIKLAAMECISAIFERSTSDVLEQYYNAESVLFLGQILLTSVEFISREKYKKLVIASINCLMAVFYVYDAADPLDIVMRNQVADTTFMFIPKVINVLHRASLSDEKVGETLISTAIKALGRIILIMFDKGDRGALPCYNTQAFLDLVTKARIKPETYNSKNSASPLSNTKSIHNIEEKLNNLKLSGRLPEWFSETASKLSQLLPQLSILRANKSIKIRKEYAKFCCQLLERASRRLEKNNIELLESVMTMSQDEDEQIRSLCKQTLRSIQSSDCRFIFEDLVDVLFDKHLPKLSRIINRCDDDEQYSEFQFLKGFFQNVPGSKLKSLLHITKNLENLCVCLISAFELKLGSDLLTEEYALRDVSQDQYALGTKTWRRFKNIASVRAFESLCDVCGILGDPDICNLVYDHLMELICFNDQIINEIYLINSLILTHDSGKGKETLIRAMITELLDEQHWHLSLQPDEMRRLKVAKRTDWYEDHTPGLYESAIEIRIQDHNSDDSDDEDQTVVTSTIAQFNVLHTCIVLDALGSIARAIGEKIRPYAFKILHKVLLKTGSSNYYVYLCGSYALSSLCTALGFTEIHKLIEAYTDYISYHVKMLLKRSSESSSACDILSVVLKYSSINTMSHLEAIFGVIQKECARLQQNDNVGSYLRVFYEFLSNVPQWISFMDKVDLTEEKNFLADIEDPDPYVQWMNILNRPLVDEEPLNKSYSHSTGVENELQEQTSLDQGTQSEEKLSKPELPRYITLTKDIVEQSLKFVASTDRKQQILALECLISGLPLLKDYEDELLPLVHRMWQPFVERIKEKDPVVLSRCFTLLRVMAVHAKDFLLRRTLGEVLPFLVKFLVNSAANSKTDRRLAKTQEFKLQQSLLQEFAALVISMQIGGRHFHNISQAVALYLSSQQPLELQTSAVKYFKDLRTYNGPFVHVVVTRNSQMPEYKDNVNMILRSFKNE